MMQRLLLIGVNHTTAPLEVREKLAFGDEERHEAMRVFHEKFSECELVLLSTCNRVEAYFSRAVHGQPKVEEVVKFLANFHGIQPETFESHLYTKSNQDVVEHLFTVAASLDSMVIGEAQILGQVREAYDDAHQLNSTGAQLNPLFQRAIAVGRQVMRETPLGEGRPSVASVAIDHARKVFSAFGDKKILSVGAGKMSGLMLRSLAALGPKELLITTRDPAKAQPLASEFGGRVVPFEKLSDELAAADIVATATTSPQPIVTRSLLEEVLPRRGDRPLFLIDIAFPRNVESSVAQLKNVHLHNLDDLQHVVSQARASRADAIAAARKIVMENVEQFNIDQRARAMGPVIDSLSKRYHELAREELSRVMGMLPNVSETEKSHLEELTRRIVNKLLHDPIQLLRQGESLNGSTAQYLHAMEKLLRLGEDAPPENEGKSSTDRSHE